MFYPFEVADVDSGLHYRLTDTLLAELSLAPACGAWNPGAEIVLNPDGVWADSLASAPTETIGVITAALEDLVHATSNLAPPSLDALPEGRARRHLAALVGLWERMGEALPEGLCVARHVLGLPHGHFLKRLPVVEGSLDPLAPEAMRALYQRLRAEFGSVPAAPGLEPAPEGSRLRAVQQGLAQSSPDQGEPDASLAFFGLRDAAACADFAAARARALIEQGCRPHDIAVMSFDDARQIARAFAAQGVPLSGLPAESPRRDIVGETLFFLLLAKRPQTPAMVLASLCLSPLMPWDRQTGCNMAERVMAGRFPAWSADARQEDRELWDDIRASASSAKQLRYYLEKICSRLREEKQVRARMQPLIGLLLAAGEGAPDWEALLRAVRIDPPAAGEPERTLEGVSYWASRESPWRPCRHLIVTDFAGDRYPSRPAIHPLFLDSELSLIAATTGLRMPGSEEKLARSLRLFESQLQAVSGSVTFLVPRRSLAGERIPPSAGLSLIARTFCEVANPAALIVDLTRTPPEQWPVSHHVLPPAPERPPLPEALDFSGRNLLALRQDKNGDVAPQSPSGLETLLVSPLAWLFDELGVEDLSWDVEGLDQRLEGNIAHDVFEQVFAPEQSLPTDEELRQAVAEAYQHAVRRHARFLHDASWEMERSRLERTICEAAIRWRDHLRDLGARVVDSEAELRGEVLGVGLRGKADVILKLQDQTRIVVDYKKSRAKSRRQRMEAGWDLQAGLYARMLAEASKGESRGADVGIGYFLMNDGGLLTSGVELPEDSMAFDMGGQTDDNAVERLTARVEQLRHGQIMLNVVGDEKFFKDEAHITPYALEKSPLIKAFTREDQSSDG